MTDALLQAVGRTVLLSSVALWGCAAVPQEDPQVALKRRVCEAVVTAYRVGVRPSALDVEVPAVGDGEPPTRLMLTEDNLPLAEQCLGLPVVRPITPAALPPTPACPGPAPPATPPAPVPAPRPGRQIDPSLDTRT